MTEPTRENGWQAGHAALLMANHGRWTGRTLLADDTTPDDWGYRLYHAPFALLSHDTLDDPCFTYANLTAQRLFEMPWQEIVGLPSRYSAEPLVRAEREKLLTQVREYGYIDDYKGVRIARSGRRFRILHATVWTLLDAQGQAAGQAAAFSDWEVLPPEPGTEGAASG